jgi:hypothetical protein
MKVFLIVLYLSSGGDVVSYWYGPYANMKDCEQQMMRTRKEMPLATFARETGLVCMPVSANRVRL